MESKKESKAETIEPTELKFAAFSSQLELPFYTSLFKFKLDHGKLDDSARFVLGMYELNPTAKSEESARMQILGNALTNNLYVSSTASSCLRGALGAGNLTHVRQGRPESVPRRGHHQER